MSVIEQLNWRYATKKFDTEKKLTVDKVTLLKEAFNLTATSYGLQPVTLFVISNDELKKELQTHAYNQSQVGDCSHLLVFCITTNVDDNFIKEYFTLVKDIRNTPDDILEPYQNFLVNDFGGKKLEEIEVWAAKQAYLALGNLMTVCALEEIDACPMEGFKTDMFDQVLDLKSKQLKSVLIMPVGYRAVDDMFADFKKVRKNVTDTVIDL
ncbi:NAD(P)H-dependent oxidoreductase [Neptunitalea lumnitzerae]|uniref:NAD(P)H-dependent oxidoreductase n=1 Tax=Neptunitalea lumnitzerae TaxID=2965509 RepID=A0ABQ5ML42_9FLAO|nr:NAD(P)H-dependent oxidoreductase [Neptunitalea sp. Y10]GLB50094.1 NAD(P)H-dependent oxidoreductase [Neptunitalea sp. Y10]